VVIVISLPVVATAIHNRMMFGTFSTSGPPPRVSWCGRTYDRGTSKESLASVDAFLAMNNLHGLIRIGSTPSGLLIVANVMTPAERATLHTNVCTMSLFVQTGSDQYLPYGLSGGP